MNNTQKQADIYLCSFYDTNLTPSAKRLNMQAKIFGVFKDIYLYNENMLTGDFREHFKDKLVPSRGFGYWVWKPYIILETMKKLNYGDILLYIDIGCHLVKTKESMKRFNDYIDIVKEHDTLSFQLSFKENEWTKQDLFEYFKVAENKDITESEQTLATIIFIKKTDDNISILKQWLKIPYDDFSLIDDSPSKIPNGPSFKEHRHDQSMWSILTKIYNLKIIQDESFKISDKFNFLDNFPIQAHRDKISIDTDLGYFIVKNNLESYDSHELKLLSMVDKIVWLMPNRNMRDKFRKKCYLKIPSMFSDTFNMLKNECKENRKYLTRGVLEINDEELCPCYSGKKYKDCHGKM